MAHTFSGYPETTMTTFTILSPRFVIARDAGHWRAYDNRDLVFVASAPFRKRKADARADAKALNDAVGLPMKAREPAAASERVGAHRARQRKAGLVRVEVYVPEAAAAAIRRYAKRQVARSGV
jgi:hypothetical protein